jgi:ABC-2 type transport system permease protein
MPELRHAWLPVARWEMSRNMRRADFILSVLLTPALLFGMSTFMAMNREGPREVAVVRADESGRVTARGEAALPSLEGYKWVDPGEAGADTAALAQSLKPRKLALALVIRPEAGGRWSADMLTPRDPPRWVRDVRAHVQGAARAERMRALGLDSARVASLDDSVVVRMHSATPSGAGSRRNALIITLAILMLTILTVITSISYMMVGISGEKQARVTEVVMSAVPAQAWMDGKIVAYTVVGLVSGAVWGGSLLLMAGPFAFQLPASVNLANLALTLVFSLLGLFFYNSLIAALMASAQNLQTASRWQSNFVMLPFLPLLFFGLLLDNPDSALMVVLTQVPLLSPFMAPVRLVQGAMAGWEVALALALLVVACVMMRRAAGRVFRLGMLMYGKDMTLPELLRWMRTG